MFMSNEWPKVEVALMCHHLHPCMSNTQGGMDIGYFLPDKFSRIRIVRSTFMARSEDCSVWTCDGTGCRTNVWTWWCVMGEYIQCAILRTYVVWENIPDGKGVGSAVMCFVCINLSVLLWTVHIWKVWRSVSLRGLTSTVCMCRLVILTVDYLCIDSVSWVWNVKDVDCIGSDL